VQSPVAASVLAEVIALPKLQLVLTLIIAAIAEFELSRRVAFFGFWFLLKPDN